MTTIFLISKIDAPIETVFELSTDISVHEQSAAKTGEKAIAGVTSGPIRLGETVTWRGKHFGFWISHQSLITAYDYPFFFVDEMVSGKFKSFRHEHSFEFRDGFTIMTDKMHYETPFGVFGKLFDWLLLKNHLTNFLLKRNRFIEQSAALSIQTTEK